MARLPATSSFTVASDSAMSWPRAFASLGQDAKTLQGEVVGHGVQLVARQQLERGVGAVVGIALGLALLDDLQKARDAGILGIDLEPDLAEARHDVGAASLVAHHDDALVADHLGIDMLVGARVLLDGRDMQAALWAKARVPT